MDNTTNRPYDRLDILGDTKGSMSVVISFKTEKIENKYKSVDYAVDYNPFNHNHVNYLYLLITDREWLNQKLT